MKRIFLAALILGFLAASSSGQAPQPSTDPGLIVKPLTDAERIAKLESQVAALQSHVERDENLIESIKDDSGLVFLYMCFTGTLASLSGRNFWLWFFLGIFTFPALIVLLVLIDSDKKKARMGAA